HNRFAGNAGGHELARLLHLLGPSHHLPSLAENGLALKLRDARVHIPRRGDGRSIGQRGLIVVLRKNIANRHVPVVHAPIALFSTSRNCVTRASFFSWGSPWRRNSPGSNSSVSNASWKRSIVQSRIETIISWSISRSSSPRCNP